MGIYFVMVIILFIIVTLVRSICIVPQSSEWIVETLGQYSGTWEAGIHLKIPFVMRVTKKVSLKEQVADFEPQPVITKDNVTMMVDSVVFFQIFNSQQFTYGVERPIAAIENLSATSLRNIIGAMTLDESLTSRDLINGQITKILDEATDKWGIKVNRVEVKNIQPPNNIREAMEKQMRAEREKREKILNAEGEKQAAITLAEGEKESAILKAEAVKERRIREAQGEAEALLIVQRARARGISLINGVGPSAQYLQLEQFEAAKAMAAGQATKIIVPSDIAAMAGNFASIAEVVKSVSAPLVSDKQSAKKPMTEQEMRARKEALEKERREKAMQQNAPEEH